MNYEKKYKEALEKAKSKFHYSDKPCFVDVTEIFPELKKTNDEEIRKKLIENFKFYAGDFLETSKWGKNDDLLVADILSWLEKQGEQKPIEKVEPKFKVGDWVIYNYPNTMSPLCVIRKIEDDIIELQDTKGGIFQTEIEDLKTNYTLLKES